MYEIVPLIRHCACVCVPVWPEEINLYKNFSLSLSLSLCTTVLLWLREKFATHSTFRKFQKRASFPKAFSEGVGSGVGAGGGVLGFLFACGSVQLLRGFSASLMARGLLGLKTFISPTFTFTSVVLCFHCLHCFFHFGLGLVRESWLTQRLPIYTPCLLSCRQSAHTKMLCPGRFRFFPFLLSGPVYEFAIAEKCIPDVNIKLHTCQQLTH